MNLSGDVLESASTATFKAFISQKTFRPSQLATVLGPVVAERRMMGYSPVDAQEKLYRKVR